MRGCHRVLPLVVAVGCGHAGTRESTGGVGDVRTLPAYIESVTRCVTAESRIDAKVEILDDPEVDAFARPGNRVVLSRGLLAHMRSEAELEAVTAHELAHLALGHVLADEPEPSDDPDLGRLAEILGAVQLAAHSRAQERDADAKAAQYLQACGRSSVALVELFDVLERLDDDDASSWFATHPSFEERRSRLRGLARDVPRRDPGHARYVEALAGLVYGDDPRDGFVAHGAYIVPALDVRIALPTTWPSRVAQRMLVSQSPQRGAFIVIARVEPGHARERLEAALAAGGFEGGEIDRIELSATQVTLAGFSLGSSGGMFVELEREEAALVLVGVAPRENWTAFAEEIQRMIESFGPIDDAGLAQPQPRRLAVVRLDRASTLASVVDSGRSAIGVAELALLNAIPPTATLPGGTVLKTVIAAPDRQPSR